MHGTNWKNDEVKKKTLKQWEWKSFWGDGVLNDISVSLHANVTFIEKKFKGTDVTQP